jgi:predicted RNA binding protein YcfA (HicA-like mRNA interferase family)
LKDAIEGWLDVANERQIAQSTDQIVEIAVWSLFPANDFVKVVERKGWVLKRVTGSHHIYKKDGMEQILSIPVHREQD